MMYELCRLASIITETRHIKQPTPCKTTLTGEYFECQNK